jgi:hypothetical protein
MRQIVHVNPRNQSIIGTYSNGSDVVFICDTSNGDITINLPDCRSNTYNSFTFKCYGPGIVTIIPVTGQYIDKDLYHALADKESVFIISDLLNNWIADTSAEGGSGEATAAVVDGKLTVHANLTTTAHGGLLPSSAFSGLAKIIVSGTEPSTPTTGDLWVNTGA